MGGDRPIVLTGAASGIGRAAAERLAEKSRILALVDVDADGLHPVASACQKHSPRTQGFACDIGDQTAVERVYEKIRKELGPAGTLINCAGIGRFAPFLEIEPADWERMFRVNVMGATFFTRAVLPDMLGAGEGLILNVSSRMAIDPHPNTTAYAASKAAIFAFSKALAMEVKERGIKVTVLAPGGAKTNIATPKHEGYLEPGVIADAIVYITENTAKNAWVRDLTILPLGF